MLGCDIGAKHLQSLSCNTVHYKCTRNADRQVNTSDVEEGGSCNGPTTEGQLRLSQEGLYSLIKIEKQIDRLLTVFDDTAVVPHNSTNRLRSGTFEALATFGAEEFRRRQNTHICILPQCSNAYSLWKIHRSYYRRWTDCFNYLYCIYRGLEYLFHRRPVPLFESCGSWT